MSREILSLLAFFLNWLWSAPYKYAGKDAAISNVAAFCIQRTRRLDPNTQRHTVHALKVEPEVSWTMRGWP